LLYNLPINRTELRAGVRDLHVVHIEKIQIGVDEDGGKEHGKEKKCDLCKCSQPGYGSRPHGNSATPQGSEPISPIKGPRVKEKYPQCRTEARFKGDIAPGLGPL
jgi:hypothetical protein